MDSLMTSFNNLDTLMQVFWVLAIVASAVFVIQFLLTLVGMDHSDIDVDFDGNDTMDLGDGFNLFTVKNFVNFFMGFGWAGVCLADSIENRVLLSVVALLVGALFVGIFWLVYKQTRRLESNGAYDINDCLGMSVTVYLRIPAGGEGKGKVQVSLNGAVHEFEAITDEDEIKSGTTVKVVEVMPGNVLKVENVENNLVI